MPANPFSAPWLPTGLQAPASVISPDQFDPHMELSATEFGTELMTQCFTNGTSLDSNGQAQWAAWAGATLTPNDSAQNRYLLYANQLGAFNNCTTPTPSYFMKVMGMTHQLFAWFIIGLAILIVAIIIAVLFYLKKKKNGGDY
jgi:membrane protein insertase Oxa1/YidC/SpoIIIJ